MSVVFDDEVKSSGKVVFDDQPLPSKGHMLMERLKSGHDLPTLGAIVGGVAGSELGPGAMGTAALGAGGGEALRQLISRARGQPSPQTSTEAAKGIGIQGALGAAGEAGGQILGKLGGMAWKGLPKLAQAMSGTPARNIAKAQLRGFGETFFPSVAKGLGRDEAGAAKGAIEEKLLQKYFKPSEIADINLRDSGVAKKIVKNSYTKWIADKGMSTPEAFRTVKAVDVIYRDTPQGMKVAPELAKLRKWADNIITVAHPEYKAAKRASEATILRSQLLKPFRVNKTNPNELSGFSGALGAFKPGGYLATAPFSPLSFGTAASVGGTLRKATTPIVRKTMQRTLIQSLLEKYFPQETEQKQ